MRSPSLVLATDLDGTFLGGSEQERSALYADLSRRDDALLIFVTGRDLDFIRELIAMPGMPRPHYIIGDVGTSVVDGVTFVPVEPIQSEIAATWNDAGERIRPLLEDEPGLRLQPTAFQYRLSYDCDPRLLRPDARRKVEEAGLDCLLSADRFFDVLPPGVRKGPTLMRLLLQLGLPLDRVLVAGDTLNDLSLFETRLKGVAVGNSEPALLQAITGCDWVFRSSAAGAGGIAEALRHFRMHLEAAE